MKIRESQLRAIIAEEVKNLMENHEDQYEYGETIEGNFSTPVRRLIGKWELPGGRVADGAVTHLKDPAAIERAAGFFKDFDEGAGLPPLSPPSRYGKGEPTLARAAELRWGPNWKER